MPDQPADSQTLLDLYVKKTIHTTTAKRTLAFDIPITGFSSFQLDTGTLRLLRQLEAHNLTGPNILDLGCGYGTIAILLAAANPAAKVLGLDRDALAVAFAQRNAAANALPSCQFRGGLDYQPLSPTDAFDAVVSNIPAKAGEPVHQAMLLNAARHLTPNGRVAIVVVSPLEPRIDAILAAEQIEILAKTPFKGHIVYIYRFRQPIPAIPWPYTRQSATFRCDKTAYRIETAYGLPEFDSLSWTTELLLKALSRLKNLRQLRRVAFLDPGQGHLPMILPQLVSRLDQTILISRDALALQQSARNLHRNQAAGQVLQFHTVAIKPPDLNDQPDLYTGPLNEDEGLDLNTEKIAQLFPATTPRPQALFATRASFAARLTPSLRARNIKVSTPQKHKGLAILQCT